VILFAQEKDFKHFAEFELGRPFALNNPDFRQNFKGFYSAYTNYNYVVKGPFTIGFSAGYTTFENTKKDRSVIDKNDIINGKLLDISLRTGISKTVNKGQFFNLLFSSGITQTGFERTILEPDSSIALDKKSLVNFGFQTSYNFFVEEFGSVGFYLRSQITPYKYDPQKMKLAVTKNKKSSLVFISFGLNFNFGIY
jgi:hypothetical protein